MAFTLRVFTGLDETTQLNVWTTVDHPGHSLTKVLVKS